MTKTIGHNGHLELFSAAKGSHRKVRIVEFIGVAAAGDVSSSQFLTDEQMIAVIDMETGVLRTADFSDSGNVLGTLKQTDSGPAGNVCWAIYTDTGI